MMDLTHLGYLSKYFCPYLSKYFCHCLQCLCDIDISQIFLSKIVQISSKYFCPKFSKNFCQKSSKYFCKKLFTHFCQKLSTYFVQNYPNTLLLRIISHFSHNEFTHQFWTNLFEVCLSSADRILERKKWE